MDSLDKDIPDSQISQAAEQAAAAAAAKLPEGVGFILLVTRCQSNPMKDMPNGAYVANCKREDAVAILKTVLFRWGINEEWMGRCE